MVDARDRIAIHALEWNALVIYQAAVQILTNTAGDSAFLLLLLFQTANQ